MTLFGSRAFARFYVGQTLGYLGDGLRSLAVPLLVFQLTHSATSVGLTFALETLPYALCGLVAGSIADRVDRRAIMLGCNGARCAIMALLSAALAWHVLSLPLLYLGIVLLSVAGGFFLTCQMPSVPVLLGRDRSSAGVAALFATEQGTNLIAPPIGGALFGLFGPLPALVINAATYLGSELSIASVRSFGPDGPSRLPSWNELRGDLVTGWRFLYRDRALRSAAGVQFFVNLFSFMGFVMIIPYLKREFVAGDGLVGIALGIIACGSIAGSVWSARTPRRVGVAVTTALLGDALVWSVTVWAGSVWLAVAAMTVSGACYMYATSCLVSWRLRVIPQHLVGRVLGLNRSVVLAGLVPGALLGGVLGDAFGLRSAMFVASAGYLAVALLFASLPAMRSERR